MTAINENAYANYGVVEYGNIADFDDALRPASGAETVAWDDPDLARITRLRLLGGYLGPGFYVYDVSYTWGVLKDGTAVNVYSLGQIRGQGGWWTNIKKAVAREGGNVSKLKVWDAISRMNGA